MEPKVWADHYSKRMWNSDWYKWELWINGEWDVIARIQRVRYNLHPTFPPGYMDSIDKRSKFRIQKQGWGSFYTKIQVLFEGGLFEEFPYFIDIKQMFQRNEPYVMRRSSKESLDLNEVKKLYDQGYRDFSKFEILPAKYDNRPFSFVGANFYQAKLSKVNLQGANLALCNFEGSDLSESNLSGANLTFARLTGANLSGAIIYGMNTTETIFEGVKATHVFLDSDHSKRLPFRRDFGKYELGKYFTRKSEIENLIPPEAPRVFISYNRRDEKTALAIDHWLREHGVDCKIDQRDFVPGDDLYECMVREVHKADKVLFIYSKNSINRHYTQLERRITQQREAELNKSGKNSKLILFLCLDDSNLPPESSHRLAIIVEDKSFPDICEEILDAVFERSRQLKNVDWRQYRNKTPW